MALVKQKTGVLIFTNSGTLAWIRYDRYDSPARVIARDILARGEAAIKEYRERRKINPGAGVLNEDRMNSLRYSLLRKKMMKEAIEVFRLNVEEFPMSFNVYDSLGEAYMASGDRELAIKNYKRSIELNPNNTNGIEMLKKLEGK